MPLQFFPDAGVAVGGGDVFGEPCPGLADNFVVGREDRGSEIRFTGRDEAAGFQDPLHLGQHGPGIRNGRDNGVAVHEVGVIVLEGMISHDAHVERRVAVSARFRDRPRHIDL